MMLSLQHTNMDTKSTSEETLSTSMVSEINEEKENIPLCNYCRKSFANYSNLRHHVQIVHLKESKWDCSKCGKVKKQTNKSYQFILFLFFIKICSSKSNLKVHFRTHIRVKPYTCKYCEYDCMHHSSIKDHLTKNHPDKPHTSIEPG
jgi:KRAB domain-containing zinc finger protein